MKQINIRVPEREGEHLEKYCEITARAKTELFREFIRNLSVPGQLPSINSVFSRRKED